MASPARQISREELTAGWQEPWTRVFSGRPTHRGPFLFTNRWEMVLVPGRTRIEADVFKALAAAARGCGDRTAVIKGVDGKMKPWTR